jgi:4-amino-4-deoxy-L-arabinose transferase-like glycosyltransferase
MRPQLKGSTFLILSLTAAAAWKIWLLSRGVFPFNSDEAVIAIMARHILGGERPIFFYGQAYMGSLDAFLVAAGFSLFGQNVWVIRLIQSLLYLVTIIATVGIGKVALKSTKIGLVAALLLAVPAVNTTLYTTVSLGGYGEALLTGSLSLWVGFGILNQMNNGSPAGYKLLALFFIWGCIVGVGGWANGLSLVFSVPMGCAILLRLLKPQPGIGRSLKNAWIVVAGFILGSLPWWLFAFQNGFQGLFTELAGSAVAVEQQSWLVTVLNHLVNLLLLGIPAVLGLRPPWTVQWLALPLIPLILIFWGAVFVFFIRKTFRHSTGEWAYPVLGGVVLIFLLLFLASPFGADPSGRYFLPLVISFSLAAAGFLISTFKKWVFQAGLVALVVIFNAWGTLQCAATTPPGITTQFDAVTAIDQAQMPALIHFLRQNGETRGYSNYWVSYPLAFLSSEELIFVPRLPYHQDLRYSSRDDRYAPYDAIVAQSDRVAYITTNNPALDEKLRHAFSNAGVTWEETQIGDFHVYYRLSKAIRPAELNLDNGFFS